MAREMTKITDKMLNSTNPYLAAFFKAKSLLAGDAFTVVDYMDWINQKQGEFAEHNIGAVGIKWGQMFGQWLQENNRVSSNACP